MKTIPFKQMQKIFEGKKIVLCAGDGKAPMKNYDYAKVTNKGTFLNVIFYYKDEVICSCDGMNNKQINRG